MEAPHGGAGPLSFFTCAGRREVLIMGAGPTGAHQPFRFHWQLVHPGVGALVGGVPFASGTLGRPFPKRESGRSFGRGEWAQCTPALLFLS